MGGDITVSTVQIRTSIRKHNHVAHLTSQGAVPKARTAYAIYTAEFWANAGASDRSKRKDLFKDAAAKWNAMSAEEKHIYREQSQQEFRKRRMAVVLWDAKQIDGPAPRTSGGSCDQGMACPAPSMDEKGLLHGVSCSRLPARVDAGPPAQLSPHDMRAVSPPAMLGEFELVDARRIGSGSYGTVVRVRHILTHRGYAAKIFLDGASSCEKEAAVYQALARCTPRHEGFLPLLAMHMDNAMSWLIMPWCCGSLGHHLHSVRGGPLSDEALWGFANQIRDALQHLHHVAHWLHLDVKPGNIMWDDRVQHAHLADFSIAEPWPVPSKHTLHRMYCTEAYRQPEMYRVGNTPVHILQPCIDAWSLGCTIYEAQTGNRLFDVTRAKADVMDFVKSAATNASHLAGTPPCAREVLKSLLHPAPDSRWHLRVPFPRPADFTNGRL